MKQGQSTAGLVWDCLSHYMCLYIAPSAWASRGRARIIWQLSTVPGGLAFGAQLWSVNLQSTSKLGNHQHSSRLWMLWTFCIDGPTQESRPRRQQALEKNSQSSVGDVWWEEGKPPEPRCRWRWHKDDLIWLRLQTKYKTWAPLSAANAKWEQLLESFVRSSSTPVAYIPSNWHILSQTLPNKQPKSPFQMSRYFSCAIIRLVYHVCINDFQLESNFL